MTKITIELQDERIQAALAKLQQQTQDLQPLLTAVGGELKKHIQLGFRNSQAPDGQAWAPLKVRQGKPLVDTGRLANSINYLVDATSVEVGTNVIYAAIHNFGGSIDRAARSQQAYFRHNEKQGTISQRFVKKHQSNFATWVTIGAHKVVMPARPFIPTVGLPPTWREGVLRIIERKLVVAE